MSGQLLKAAVFILVSFVLNLEAAAQSQRNGGFTLEFNRSPAQAISMLERRGFTDVKILKRQLLALDVEACRQGVRLQFKLRLDGRIFDERRLGSCTSQLTEIEVRKIAEDSGFQDILIVKEDSLFRVTGCRVAAKRRESFVITSKGRVVGNRILGECANKVPFEDIAKDLKNRRFDRVELKSEGANSYIITACRRNRSFQLEVGFDGLVRSDRVTGQCRPPIDVRDIASVVERAGYERVVVTDDEPPRYLAEGCREGVRYEISISRYGQLRDPREIGRCRPSMNNEALAQILVREGFYSVKIERGRRARFLASACYAKRKYEVDYSRHGDLVGEREVGKCRPMNPSEMLATAIAREAQNPEPQIKACRNGRAILFELDRDGVIGERSLRGQRC